MTQLRYTKTIQMLLGEFELFAGQKVSILYGCLCNVFSTT